MVPFSYFLLYQFIYIHLFIYLFITLIFFFRLQPSGQTEQNGISIEETFYFFVFVSFNILGISTRNADLGRFKGALWVKTIFCMYFKLITGCMIIAFERILISLFRKPQNAYQHWNIRNIALYIGAAPSIWL